MNFAWLDPSREQFKRLSTRLPHAILIHGEPGVGKSAFALEIVASLLCDQPIQAEGSLQACGQCHNCVLFGADSHPDFHYLATEQFVENSDSAHLVYAERYLEDESKRRKRKSRQIISVDQVRALIQDFSLSHHSAQHKVALIEPADAMNTNAANALLKLLEEPNPDSVLILVSSDTSQLPMTIRSRCVSLAVHKPAPDLALQWLHAQQIDDMTARKAMAISGGAPLVALSYCRSEEIQLFENLLSVLSHLLQDGMGPVQAREALVKGATPGMILSWLQIVMSCLIQLSTTRDGAPQMVVWEVYKQDLSKLLQGLGKSSVSQLFNLYEDVVQIKKQDTNIINLGLALDKWLIAFAQRLAKARA